MPNIPSYEAPTTRLNPSDSGFAAFETAGRRIAPQYDEAANMIREGGKLAAQQIRDRQWPLDIFMLRAHEQEILNQEDKSGFRVLNGGGSGGSSSRGGRSGGTLGGHSHLGAGAAGFSGLARTLAGKGKLVNPDNGDPAHPLIGFNADGRPIYKDASKVPIFDAAGNPIYRDPNPYTPGPGGLPGQFGKKPGPNDAAFADAQVEYEKQGATREAAGYDLQKEIIQSGYNTPDDSGNIPDPATVAGGSSWGDWASSFWDNNVSTPGGGGISAEDAQAGSDAALGMY